MEQQVLLALEQAEVIMITEVQIMKAALMDQEAMAVMEQLIIPYGQVAVQAAAAAVTKAAAAAVNVLVLEDLAAAAARAM